MLTVCRVDSFLFCFVLWLVCLHDLVVRDRAVTWQHVEQTLLARLKETGAQSYGQPEIEEYSWRLGPANDIDTKRDAIVLLQDDPSIKVCPCFGCQCLCVCVCVCVLVWVWVDGLVGVELEFVVRAHVMGWHGLY